MITAKQWKEKYPMAFDDYCAGVVEQIQLDAFKAGMEFAAKVANEFKLGKCSGWIDLDKHKSEAINAILTAAAQLTEVPR